MSARHRWPPGSQSRPLAATPPAATPHGGLWGDVTFGLLRQASPVPEPVLAGYEFSAPSYARAPGGELVAPDPAHPFVLRNQLPIVWPFAREDWGSAQAVAMFQAGSDVVLGNAPIARSPFIVLAGDQPRIGALDMMVYGVPANSKRPFGAAMFGRSHYGTFPAAGYVFRMVVIGPDYAWDRQDNACAGWAAPAPIQNGGCCTPWQAI
jgi:hypothetical protein